ncbi:hypothetical protein HYU06_06290 [Candidatus Woesearchaeota archaeon]|nr:hypothetical protein [Candidatus Woesearchaeota archaeon]
MNNLLSVVPAGSLRADKSDDVLNNSFYSELEQELGVKGKDMDVIPNNVIALPSYKENVFEKYRMAA